MKTNQIQPFGIIGDKNTTFLPGIFMVMVLLFVFSRLYYPEKMKESEHPKLEREVIV